MPKDPITVKVRLTQVRVIEVRGPSAVVEYSGGLKRCIVPLDDLIEFDSNTVAGATPETLEMGIPYGIPWEQVLTLSATPQKLADKLRANGIWTKEDLEANPTAAFGALQAVYGIDLAALYQAAYGGK